MPITRLSCAALLVSVTTAVAQIPPREVPAGTKGDQVTTPAREVPARATGDRVTASPREVPAGTPGDQIWVGDIALMTMERVAEDARPGRLRIRWFGPEAVTFGPNSLSAFGNWEEGKFGKALRRWDLAHAEEVVGGRVKLIDSALKPRPCQAAFSADGKQAVWADSAGLIHVLDWTTGKQIREFKTHPLNVIAMSADGRRLATAGYQNSFRVWDVATGKEIAKGPATDVTVQHMQFTADGRTLAWSGDFVPIGLFDVERGREGVQLETRPSEIRSLAISPDGRRLALGERLGVLSMWDATTGKPVYQLRRERGSFGIEGIAEALAFSADGRTLAMATSNSGAFLLEVATGRPRAKLVPRAGRVSTCSIAFSADSRLVAISADDLNVFDLAFELSTENFGEPFKKHLSEARVNDLWNDLADMNNSRAAYSALWTLASHPAEAMPRLKNSLRSVAPVPARQIDQWIRDLDHERFANRERASKELHGIAEHIAPSLRAAVAAKPSAEGTRRINELLAKALAWEASPEWVVTLRRLELLERIETPAARELFAQLAAGAADAAITREATAALGRLTQNR